MIITFSHLRSENSIRFDGNQAADENAAARAWEAHRNSGRCRPKKEQIRCPVPRCKTKLVESNTYHCKICGTKVCMAHRFEEDHGCQERKREAARTGGLRQYYGGIEARIRKSVKNVGVGGGGGGGGTKSGKLASSSNSTSSRKTNCDSIFSNSATRENFDSNSNTGLSNHDDAVSSTDLGRQAVAARAVRAAETRKSDANSRNTNKSNDSVSVGDGGSGRSNLGAGSNPPTTGVAGSRPNQLHRPDGAGVKNGGRPFWTCKECTLHNDLQSRECVACGWKPESKDGSCVVQ